MKLFNKVYLMLGGLILSVIMILIAAINGGITFDSYKALTIMAVVGLFPFISSPISQHQLSPSRLFSISILIFILARPIINIFGNVELVQVGNGISDTNLFNVMLMISISIWIAGLTYLLSLGLLNQSRVESVFKCVPYLAVPSPKGTSDALFFVFILCGFLFLFRSVNAASMMTGLDYFSVVSDSRFHEHLYLFFLAKNIGLLWVLTRKTVRSIDIYIKILLFFSLGFLLVGLRGYFVAYLFLFLFIYTERKRLNILSLTTIAVLGLYFSSLILEYRLGFNVYDNFFSMITIPFYQQGATFEVVFGAIVFPDSLNECLSFIDYFSGNIAFGDCVDKVRKVPFVEGGFASSFFAEAFYLGLVPYVAFSVIMGFSIAFLDRLSLIGIAKDGFIAKLILISVLPNLVYVARSSAFDFIVKLFLIVAITFFIYRKYDLDRGVLERS